MKLRIEKAIYGGDGLAHDANGKTIFVPAALPGEMVEATLVEDKRSYSQSRLQAVDEPSPERTVPQCEYVPRCGGCHYQHSNYPYQLQMKLAILRETLSRARLTVPEEIETLSGPPWGYRNRIRLHVTKSGLAYRQRASHHLLPVSHCPIAAPLLQEAIPAMVQSGAHEVCEEIELFTNGEQLLLSLVPGTHKQRNSLGAIAAGIPSVAGIGLAGERWGKSYLEYHVGQFSYRVSLGSFFQVNRFVLPDFLSLVLAWAGSGKLAWDLYSGVGLFARALPYEHVIAVESAPSAEDIEHNLAGKSHHIVRAGAHHFLRRPMSNKPDLILVDPPRAGVGRETAMLLANAGAEKIIYVSCDPSTLARDLQLLSQFYSIEKMRLVDLFPQTFHMETVTLLQRLR